MRDEDKPFICIKNGWQMNIRPRNAEGWKQFGYWMLLLIPIVVPFVWAMERPHRPAMGVVYGVAYVGAMLAWVFNMIRWMLARSQIINLRAENDPNRGR